MKTKVKIEFYKYTGKWYDSFEFETELESFHFIEIKEQVKKHKSFIKNMNFIIEVESLYSQGWNKYLFNSELK